KQGEFEVCSPRECAQLDHVSFQGFKYPDAAARQELTDMLDILYQSDAKPEDVERRLKIIGIELAGLLPKDIVDLLRLSKIKSVMLRHEDDFDFPLELVYLDDARDPFFVGDRKAICRWYMGVTNLPDIINKRIERMAFVKGTHAAAETDEAYLRTMFGNRFQTVASTSEIVTNVFRKTDFDAIQFTGHCLREANAGGGLELANGDILQVIEVGQLMEERAFGGKNPFIVLNACASAKPYQGLMQRNSFVHRFINSQACAVVGTLWPVEVNVANQFTSLFYEKLQKLPIGQALIATKQSIANDNTKDEDERRARQVAVRSYCLFANPDLRLSTQ
ncbi:MAG: CHAT domain-containing protein, partial [Rhizobiaceae bacterium]|nr:CHAT domain-containing protein [Rhizobiaceae bacterium]